MGKCSGGKKLGVSLNFPTEETFMKKMRKDISTFAILATVVTHRRC